MNQVFSHRSGIQGFNSQSPTKGTAIFEDLTKGANVKVSILSPQQRGLQSDNGQNDSGQTEVSILSPQQRGLQFKQNLEFIEGYDV